MTEPHPHAAAIDRVGTDAIMEHFNISRQAVSYWRLNGVPRQSQKPLVLLGESLGHDMADMKEAAGMVPAAADDSPAN